MRGLGDEAAEDPREEMAVREVVVAVCPTLHKKGHGVSHAIHARNASDGSRTFRVAADL